MYGNLKRFHVNSIETPAGIFGVFPYIFWKNSSWKFRKFFLFLISRKFRHQNFRLKFRGYFMEIPDGISEKNTEIKKNTVWKFCENSNGNFREKYGKLKNISRKSRGNFSSNFQGKHRNLKPFHKISEEFPYILRKNCSWKFRKFFLFSISRKFRGKMPWKVHGNSC